ncbi:hypothetical protein [Bacillus subtilis]|uniref:hypothetical protein n=1 Tax=Bacillus subtilis TaxID=1423 RepID=UPI0013BB44E8|nr:hypothetical protein [Bacillus subtilis]KAF2425579.1 hypothetical protein B6K89_09150 [Bacillus subtilis]
MKEMALENIAGAIMENEKQDRLEQVLVDGEMILNRVNARLDKINKLQKKMEDTLKAFEGTVYLKEWKLEKEGVK